MRRRFCFSIPFYAVLVISNQTDHSVFPMPLRCFFFHLLSFTLLFLLTLVLLALILLSLILLTLILLSLILLSLILWTVIFLTIILLYLILLTLVFLTLSDPTAPVCLWYVGINVIIFCRQISVHSRDKRYCYERINQDILEV